MGEGVKEMIDTDDTHYFWPFHPQFHIRAQLHVRTQFHIRPQLHGRPIWWSLIPNYRDKQQSFSFHTQSSNNLFPRVYLCIAALTNSCTFLQLTPSTLKNSLLPTTLKMSLLNNLLTLNVTQNAKHLYFKLPLQQYSLIYSLNLQYTESKDIFLSAGPSST